MLCFTLLKHLQNSCMKIVKVLWVVKPWLSKSCGFQKLGFQKLWSGNVWLSPIPPLDECPGEISSDHKGVDSRAASFCLISFVIILLTYLILKPDLTFEHPYSFDWWEPLVSYK